MALVDVEGVFYATVLVGGTRQATAATKWAPIPACSGIPLEMLNFLDYIVHAFGTSTDWNHDYS